LREARIKAFE